MTRAGSGAVADRPCRHACGHYDCRMDRGEDLPAHVTAYQDGVRYRDRAARDRARAEAIRVVDRLGSSIEYASDPAFHARAWDEEEARILAADGDGGSPRDRRSPEAGTDRAGETLPRQSTDQATRKSPP